MKGQKKRIVGVTFSAFDLCHAGHVLMLKDCKSVCDYLIVGLQSDPSTTDPAYRGKTKRPPIMSLAERRIILEGNKYIDEIFTYDTEEDLYEWLKNNPYDVRIIGSDWKGKKYTGWDLPHQIYYHERNHGWSTSELRERIYQAERQKRELEIIKEANSNLRPQSA